MDIEDAIRDFLTCRVNAVIGNRVFLHTKLDGHTLLWLEQRLRDATGNRELELFCESLPDKNVLRRLKEMRGVNSGS